MLRFSRFSLWSSPSVATSNKFTAPLKSHIKETLLKKNQNQNFTFAKYGAILILSKTNSLRTLIAEAFIKGAIERRMELIEQQNTPQKKNNDVDNNLDEQKTKENEGTLEIDAELMYSDSEKFDQKLKEFHQEHQRVAAEGKSSSKLKEKASSPIIAHPNLRTVVSAGRLQVVSSTTSPALKTSSKSKNDDDENDDCHGLPPLVKQILLDEFGDKIPRKILEGDEQQLWRKGISSISHQLNCFDVIVSIVDGERLLGENDIDGETKSNKSISRENQNNTSLYDDDYDDDDEDNSDMMMRKSSSSLNNDDDDVTKNIYSEHLDADPFTRIPGLEHLQRNITKATGRLEANCTPTHWKVDRDGSYRKNKFVTYSPRRKEVADEESLLKLQDEYDGEPQFNEPKRLKVSSSVKKVRWFLPSMESLSTQLSFETDEEYRGRVLKTIRKIDKMVDELCCVDVRNEE